MKIKEWFYKSRFYFLGILVMYCSVRRTFRPNGWLFLIELIGFFVLFSVFLYSLTSGIKERKERGYKGFILPLFCIAVIFISFRYGAHLGLAMRDAEFRARIVDYNSVVDAIKAGKVSFTRDGADLKYQVDLEAFKNLPPTVQKLWAIRREDCELRVYFYTEHLGGALGTTMGIVYIEQLKNSPCKKPWPSSEYLTPMPGMDRWFSLFEN